MASIIHKKLAVVGQDISTSMELAAQQNTPCSIEAEHRHCNSCYSSKCKYFEPTRNLTNSNDVQKNEQNCPMTQCSFCSWFVMHRCKVEEHWLLCPEVIVDCINKSNGCPMQMPRRHLAQHLASCAASVCICTVEWNRRPAYAVRDSIGDVSGAQTFSEMAPPAGYSNQLDVGLTLRDQALLDEAMLAPRSLRRSMTNWFTKHFPAMPLPKVQQGFPNYEEAKSGNSAELLRSNNSGSETDEAIGIERALTSSVARASADEQHERCFCEISNSHNASPISRFSSSPSNASLSSNSDSDKVADNYSPPGLAASFLKIICDLPEKQQQLNTRRRRLIKIFPAERQRADVLSEAVVNNSRRSSTESGSTAAAQNTFTSSCSLAAGDDDGDSSGRFTQDSPAPTFDGKIYSRAENCSENFENSNELHYLGLHLQHESLVHYQPKPKSLLTFTCHQLFRRDQFADHYLNVHANIQSALPWIEQRCPLAYMGCTWSVRRCRVQLDNAGVSKSTFGNVVYSQLLRSFAIENEQHFVPAAGECTDPQSRAPRSLGDLPDEILFNIFSRLDNFSLSTLAVCNSRIRRLCSALLYSHGIVTQEWVIDNDPPAKKTETNKTGALKNRWKIGYQKWHFTTHFHGVERWHIQSITQQVSKHLHSECAFYEPVDHTKVPFVLPDVPYRQFRQKKTSVNQATQPFGPEVEAEEWIRAMGLRVVGDYAV